MLTATTITERLNGYTYATITATTYHHDIITADIIIYDNSTAEEVEIWAEFDDCDGLDYAERSRLLTGYDYDGFMSIAEALQDMEYHFYKYLRHLGYDD